MQPKSPARHYRSPSRSPLFGTASPIRTGARAQTSPSNRGTPYFIQCILLFVVMVIVIGLIITFRAHIPGVESIPSLPSEYMPQYTTDIEHTSHIENVHEIIDNLEFIKSIFHHPTNNQQI